MGQTRKTTEVIWVLCVIAYALLRVFTWNGHSPVWAATLRDILLGALVVYLVLSKGPRAIWRDLYGRQALARRGRTSLFIALIATAVLLPPLLWLLYVRCYEPMTAALNATQ
jgi:hypothetical protein